MSPLSVSLSLSERDRVVWNEAFVFCEPLHDLGWDDVKILLLLNVIYVHFVVCWTRGISSVCFIKVSTKLVVGNIVVIHNHSAIYCCCFFFPEVAPLDFLFSCLTFFVHVVFSCFHAWRDLLLNVCEEKNAAFCYFLNSSVWQMGLNLFSRYCREENSFVGFSSTFSLAH